MSYEIILVQQRVKNALDEGLGQAKERLQVEASKVKSRVQALP
jgi:hypothetical protein